jgi:hypothetical protein
MYQSSSSFQISKLSASINIPFLPLLLPYTSGSGSIFLDVYLGIIIVVVYREVVIINFNEG